MAVEQRSQVIAGYSKSHAEYFQVLFAQAHFRHLPSKYVVVDCETTGTDYKNDAIVQLGYAVVEDNQLAHSGGIIINVPDDVKFNEEAVRVTGIGREKCSAEGVPPKDAFETFYGLVQEYWNSGYGVVGHNLVQFDLPFFHIEATRYNVKFAWAHLEPQLIDTGMLAKACQIHPQSEIARLPSHKESRLQFYRRIADARLRIKWNLGFSYEFFGASGLCVEGDAIHAHDAAGDCIMTHCLWRQFQKLGGRLEN